MNTIRPIESGQETYVPSMRPAPLAYPINAACARLGIGRTVLYELLKSGAIRHFKIGTRTLIPEAELQRFVAEQMQTQKVAA